MSVISIESSEEETLKRVNPKDLDLTGLEALSFDYVVKWPLSLIISRKKIVHYQLLFRFLFYTKHIERIVNNVWLTSTQLTKVILSRLYSSFINGFYLFSNMDVIRCTTRLRFCGIKC